MGEGMTTNTYTIPEARREKVEKLIAANEEAVYTIEQMEKQDRANGEYIPNRYSIEAVR